MLLHRSRVNLKAFQAVDPNSLTADDRADRALILEELEELEFDHATLDEPAWNPCAPSILLSINH